MMIQRKPFKALADIRTSNVDKKTVIGQQVVELCNYTDVYNSDAIKSGMEFMVASASDVQVNRLTLRGGDVIFTKDSETPDDIAVSAFVPVDLPGVVCGYHLAIASPRKGVALGRFIYWAMQSKEVISQFQVAATGVTRFGLRQSSIGDVLVPAPPVNEQQRIANLLDRECSQMKVVVEEHEHLATLVEERDRTAVKRLITGQDVAGPHEMRGPWWLAPTPSSWKPYKISRNFRTGSGTTPRSGDHRYYGGPYPWLNTGECNDSLVFETAKTVTDEALAEHSALKFYPAGSVVVAMYGATIGKLAVLGAPMTLNQACVALYEPKNLDPWFTYWWLWAHRTELMIMGEGGGQPNINQETVKQLVIPAPDRGEQHRIVDRIVEMRSWSQQIRESVDEQSILLAERREALITDSVAGLKEVA